MTAKVAERSKVKIKAKTTRVYEHVYGRAFTNTKERLQAYSEFCGYYTVPEKGCWIRTLPERSDLGFRNFPPPMYEHLKSGATPGMSGATSGCSPNPDQIGGSLGKTITTPGLLLGPVT